MVSALFNLGLQVTVNYEANGHDLWQAFKCINANNVLAAFVVGTFLPGAGATIGVSVKAAFGAAAGEDVVSAVSGSVAGARIKRSITKGLDQADGPAVADPADAIRAIPALLPRCIISFTKRVDPATQSMSTIIAALVFVFGVFIAVLSVYLVLERKRSWLWYALPSFYCVIVDAMIASMAGESMDLAAILFFSTVLTVIGWLTVRFDLRRR